MKLLRTCLTATAIGAFAPAALAQVSVTDDNGRTVQMKNAPQRIVTLAPFLTEMVFALGAGDRLVGVSSLSTYPPEATKLPQVATGATFQVAQIAPLKPDLVLAWRDGTRTNDIAVMSAFGAQVFVAQARTLEDVPRLLKLIGAVIGRDSTPAVNEYEGKLDKLRKTYALKSKVPAFLEIWNRPLTTVSGAHFMSEALEICRAENVFKDVDGTAPQVSYDEVGEKNPYVIVGAGSAGTLDEFRSNWTVRQGIPAVKAERFVFIDSDAFQRPTPRTPDGIAQLCAGIDTVRPASPLSADRARKPSQYGM
jgi:iron complex transport system substrate-binding protein